MRRVGLALCCAVALSLPGIARAAPIGSPGALKLISTQRIDSRLLDLAFETPALTQSPTHVRVLLPAGYASSKRRYPVLLLLHGCCDNYKSWTAEGNAEAITAKLPLIVVMPAGGEGGFYSDWYNNGSGGPPMWETYHIYELLPWIDEHFRTIAKRSARAVAGLSMGGYGAMEYAARHPDLFVAAASFSGAVDNMDPTAGQADAVFPGLDGGMPNAVWGPQNAEEVVWRGHNPVDLANNLRGLSLTIRTGNGEPGGPYGGGPDALEAGVHHESQLLEETLTQLGIPSIYQDYGPGAHQWPYWQRDLRLTLPTIMATFTNPPAPPAVVTYTSIKTSYSVFGWQVAIHRQVKEFSTLVGASPRGFTVDGSGTAVVRTPAVYRPGARYAVTVTTATGTVRRVMVAPASRRLAITVSLGPSNSYQEFSAQAQEFGRQVEQAVVRIAAVTRRRSRAR